MKHKIHQYLFICCSLLILTINGTAQTFVQQAKLLASDGAGTADSLGFSVAISGDTAILGAPRNGPSRGAAYVYIRSGTTWTQQQKLIHSDAMGNDQFGYSVAINGDTAAVGRYNTVTGANRSDGKVYIFTRTGTSWSQTQMLVSTDIAQGDVFGYALAFENDTLVIGARNKTNGANLFQGAAYIFTRPSGGSFTQQAKLLASDGGFADFFGESVTLSGDTAIIGSVNDFGTPNAIGKAYVFVRNGSTWTQQQILQAVGGSPNGNFGVGVSISGDTALIGARTEVIAGGEVGAAYAFVRSGTVWTQTQKFTSQETMPANDQFGYGVAVRGDVIAIGSPAHDLFLPLPQGQIFNNGAVYVYNRSGGGNFTRTQKLIQNDPTPGGLGQALAIDGSSILAGQAGHDSSRGTAYVFASNSVAAARRTFDFDGDGRSDFAVYRVGTWFINPSGNSSSFNAVQFGLATDKLAPADYDGDGKTDVAIWRENVSGNAAYFYILNSLNGTVRIEQFGLTGDKLTIGDWDGDGKADLSVYRNGAQGYFYYRGSLNNPNGNTTYLPWGAIGDKPLRGDFDGDGKFDVCVYRASNQTWYIRQSSNLQVRHEAFGLSSDSFVPADYDGDGKADIAVFRNGVWYIRQSSSGQIVYYNWGLTTDSLVPADYDGDGRADVAVWRSGVWYVLQSGSGNPTYGNFGTTGDTPAESSYGN